MTQQWNLIFCQGHRLKTAEKTLNIIVGFLPLVFSGNFFSHITLNFVTVKYASTGTQSRDRPGVAQRVPGS